MAKKDEVTQLLYDIQLDKALEAYSKGDDSLMKKISDPNWGNDLYTEQMDGGIMSKFYVYCTGKTKNILMWNFATSPEKFLVFMVHEDQLGHKQFVDREGQTFSDRLESILGYTYKGRWERCSITNYAQLTQPNVTVEHPQCFSHETMQQFITPAQIAQLDELQKKHPDQKISISKIVMLKRSNSEDEE